VGRPCDGVDVYFMNALITGGDPAVDAMVSIKYALCSVVLDNYYRARNVNAAGIRARTGNFSQGFCAPLLPPRRDVAPLKGQVRVCCPIRRLGVFCQ